MRHHLLAAASAATLTLTLAACTGMVESDPPGRTVPAGTPSTGPAPTTVRPAPPTTTRDLPGGGPMSPNPYALVDARTVASSPDGTQAAAGCLKDPQGSGDSTVSGGEWAACVWDVRTGEVTHRFSGSAVLAWSPDGSLLAVEESRLRVALLDARTGDLRHLLEGHSTPDVTDYSPSVRAADFSADGKTLVTAGDDGAVIAWDTTTGRETDRLTGEFDSIGLDDVSIAPDGRVALAGDQGVKVWRPGGGVEAVAAEPLQASSVAWSPDGTRLAATGDNDRTHYDGRLWLFDAQLSALAVQPGEYATDAAWAPDGRTLAWSDIGTREVLTWRVDEPQARVIGGLAERVDGVDWTADSKHLLVGSTNIGVAVLDPGTGGTLRTLVP